jgi:hypothetical protein
MKKAQYTKGMEQENFSQSIAGQRVQVNFECPFMPLISTIQSLTFNLETIGFQGRKAHSLKEFPRKLKSRVF